MFTRYVLADLVRNPRRTLSTAVGVLLGIGLFCGVLFFVDGLSASMTQRAVAPLPIDMQRILTEPIAADLRMNLTVTPAGPAKPGDRIAVRMEMLNQGALPANEVTVRSAPIAGIEFDVGSAVAGGRSLAATAGNPFSVGLTKAGLNVGTMPPRSALVLTYQATVSKAQDIGAQSFPSAFSSREVFYPVDANSDEKTGLADLLGKIRAVDGVTFAEPLFLADLAPGALSAGKAVDGPVRVFGFDAPYASHDRTVEIVEGSQRAGAAVISAEAAASLAVGVGGSVAIGLPDGSRIDLPVSGIADLSRARALFSSRRGADLETFIYVPNTVVIDTTTFTDMVLPAFARATTGRGERVKSPPVREIDIGIARDLLDAEPGAALEQTQRLARIISAVAEKQDFLLDNISNTLAVARDDASVAKHMFVFLGVPGAMLAAMLAAYAGVVLGSAQRRERATLRIRGASRKNLLSMLALRVSGITGFGALIGLSLGYASAATVIGHATLMRAETVTLVGSALLGVAMGLLATGAALYLSGRRSIDQEINEDRALLWMRPPLWRRYGLDFAGIAVVAVITAVVAARSGFQGTPGSVYVGRAVQLPLGLLVLPIGAWVAGCFLGGRTFALFLERWRPAPANLNDRPLALLYWMSVKRRSWSLADAAVILALIVALGAGLAVFTASYDGAKIADARYVTGSDVRITPGPAREPSDRIKDTAAFAVDGIVAVAPVIYGVHNMVLRSKRTSEVANVAALDPATYGQVAPLDAAAFPNGSPAAALGMIAGRGDAILLSRHMAKFLEAKTGDRLRVLLARGTAQQVEIEMEIAGLYERLPGFPDGADALMNIERFEQMVPSTAPTFFLAKAGDGSDSALASLTVALRNIPALGADLHIETRLTALAKDQSSLAALNIGGLLKLDYGYVLAMGTVTIAIFVFGLLLQRRREYVTLRALGMAPGLIRTFIGAEVATVVLAGCAVGMPVGLVMAWFLINVLRPLFVLAPPFVAPFGSLGTLVGCIVGSALITSLAASSLVNQLAATELLRDE
ncbi:MAG: ABC transporter permease [Paracoccaceae bacterium]